MEIKYSPKVVDHLMNPRNVGVMENPDGTGIVGNPKCGDVMRLFIKVKDGRVENCMFQTFGCGAAIATSSILTELVKGKTLEEALELSNKDVVTALDGLPAIKQHCSLLAEEGLKAAIEDYYKKNPRT